MQGCYKVHDKNILKLVEQMDESCYVNNLHYQRGISYKIIKRIIDIIGAILGLIIISPVLIIVSIAIKLSSKGNIIFSQNRVGKNGKIFRMYKFRSMVNDAENVKSKLCDQNEMSGPMFKIKNDPRITTVGKIIRKTSIDELPQLINILKGDMSLVGPRPNLPEEVEKFSDFQKLKLKVTPGLTCYWQVMGRSSIDFENWMKLDIKYIEDRNTLLDIKLILKTVKLLFGDKNAK